MSLYHHLMTVQKYSGEGEEKKSHPYLIGKVITFTSEPQFAALLACFQVRSISPDWGVSPTSLYCTSATKCHFKDQGRSRCCCK